MAGTCGGDSNCNDGVCECQEGTTDCNDVCVSTSENAFHCGGCGIECGSEQKCESGSCVCESDFLLCDALCVDPLSDAQHCGGCDSPCNDGESCEGGSCVCAAELTACEGACIDTSADVNNCGGCGITCASHESCAGGVCQYENDDCGPLAVNVSIASVTLTQGVEAQLFDGQSAVAAQDRAVDVIAGREALVRVHVAPSVGFSAREISARLFVENDGDVEVIYEKKRLTGSASSTQDLDSTFNLSLPETAINEDTEYWVELAECEAAPAGESEGARAPNLGQSPLAAIRTGQVKVLIVPIRHEGIVPDTSEETLALYADAMAAMYPTTGVEISVTDEIESGETGNRPNMETLLTLVTDHRATLDLENEVYLYGMIDPAASFSAYCGQACTTGVGWVLEGVGPFTAMNRAAVGVGFGNFGVGTFVHEVGHNHGRFHAPCGVQGDPYVDTNFPHTDATIGVWGYDRRSQSLKSPQATADFLSYCEPTWISDYTFNALAERITALSGPAAVANKSGSARVDQLWQRILVTSQEASWLKPVRGPSPSGPSAELAAIYDQSGQLVAKVPVYRVEMADARGAMIYVPSAEPGWTAIELADGTGLAY